ncbi:hypothetical protein ENSA5_65800 [Enhygromyxa salina]|uniref:Uncharacterized protein n=1 Tax=Enhygromyxa salina TaxID=215803 RepID=A0A2S9XBQ9_9BACT|nr:hypothetical protein ENSA5_65800 [Enhygromyxa salina]
MPQSSVLCIAVFQRCASLDLPAASAVDAAHLHRGRLLPHDGLDRDADLSGDRRPDIRVDGVGLDRHDQRIAAPCSLRSRFSSSLHQPVTGYTAIARRSARSAALHLRMSACSDPRRRFCPRHQSPDSLDDGLPSSSSSASLLSRLRNSSRLSAGRFTSKRNPCDWYRCLLCHPRRAGFGSTKYDKVTRRRTFAGPSDAISSRGHGRSCTWISRVFPAMKGRIES